MAADSHLPSPPAQEEFIALYELAGTKAMRRLTLGGRNRFPVWASNGRRVAYQSDREGDVSIFWQPADGSGAPERLTKAAPGESHAPESWSPTTNTLLFSVLKDGAHTLWALSLPDKNVAPIWRGALDRSYQRGRFARRPVDGVSE